MPLPDFAVNPKARLSGFAVGRDASPVLVIDDAFADPDAITAFGRNEAAFETPATAYPGLNAAVPDGFLAPLIAAIRSTLADAYGIPADFQIDSRGYYGLVTLRPEVLTPGQSIPHVDNVGHRGLAAVAYLCDEDQGGTGFYRHRTTGFERLTQDTLATYNAVLQFETRNGLPPAYTVGDHALFERIGHIEARFNRLAIYNCNLLHSGQVDPARLSADPAKGRLTLNGFIAEI